MDLESLAYRIAITILTFPLMALVVTVVAQLIGA